MGKTWIDAFRSWWQTETEEREENPTDVEYVLAQNAYGAGRDCGRAEMQFEVNDLQAIVDRLPKTADGVPVTPGMDLYEVRTKACGCAEILKRGNGNTVEVSRYARRYGHMVNWLLNTSDYYSTREAAEAARNTED